MERQAIHQSHEEMSDSNINMEMYRNKSLVLDAHIDKLKRKINETNRILI